ncbi:hypothetical protein HZS_4927 [Henneguya salminicola]|nr:hypothetical protein HZS_4927 [Henneguya salminicola]
MVQRDNSSLKSTQIQPCVNSSRNIFEFKNKLLEVEDEIKDRQHSKKSQLYYHQINELIEYLRDNNIIEEKKLELLTDKSPDHVHVPIERRSPSNLIERNNKRAFYAAKVALILNTLLLIAKIIACVFSRSISVISSTIDSAVDILSSVITFFTNYKIKKLNVYKHPQGKTRLIPLSVIIISAIMAITSLEVITASFRRIITGVDLIPDFSIVAIVIVVGSKFFIINSYYCH